MSLLFEETTLGDLNLKNRIVMAPLTRSRAVRNLPNGLMAEYYAQRASVGLIISEGVSPSDNGLGYPRSPGIYTEQQTEGWKAIADAVHEKDGKIFMQLMHCGRYAHPDNLPIGAHILAPSAIAAEGQINTDTAGMQTLPVPIEMTRADLEVTIKEFADAAKNAMNAGFDGVQLHAGNGYLLEQFIRPTSNKRTRKHGGSTEKRVLFVLEVVDAVIAEIGNERLGICLSPFSTFHDMPLYDDMEKDYLYLVEQLNDRGLLYIHLVDHASKGMVGIPDVVKEAIREKFSGALILSGGYDAERSEADLEAGKGDLIAIGRPVLSNPDLVHRWKIGAELNEFDVDRLTTDGAEGYTDYPTL